MLRNCTLIVLFVLMLLVGECTQSCFGCPGCGTDDACLVFNEEADVGLLSTLIDRQPTDSKESVAELKKLISMQLRLRAKVPFLIEDDIKLLATFIEKQEALMVGIEPAKKVEALTILEKITSLHMRGAACKKVRTPCGTPPGTTGGSCCNKPAAKCCGKCGTPACTCGGVSSCCKPHMPVVIQQTFIEDKAEVNGIVEGINVSTCNGPVQTGQISIYGRGKESSRFAAVLQERAMLQREREFNRAMDAQATCNMRIDDCCGITRPLGSPGCGSCSMPGVRGVRTGVRPMTYVNPVPTYVGSVARVPVTGRCVAWNRVRIHLECYAEPPNGRPFWCNCPTHQRRCIELYGPDVVWELIPCACAGQGCTRCAAGGGCGNH